MNILASEHEFDEGDARRVARFVLGCSEPHAHSPIAEMQTKNAPGEMKLSAPKSPYTIHASATRRAQYSQPLINDHDFSRSRIAKTIYSLPHPMPSAIAWRCHVDRHARQQAGRRLANYVAELFSDRSRKVELRASSMAHAIVAPGGIARPWELPWINLSQGAWRDSGERRTWNEVEREIFALESDALRVLFEMVGA